MRSFFLSLLMLLGFQGLLALEPFYVEIEIRSENGIRSVYIGGIKYFETSDDLFQGISVYQDGEDYILSFQRKAVSSSTPPPPVVSLTAITLSPANASMNLGEQKVFSASGTYSDGTTKTLSSSVVWSSSNTNVVSMNSGVATAIGVGSSTISAVLSGITGSTLLTVVDNSGYVLPPVNFTVSALIDGGIAYATGDNANRGEGIDKLFDGSINTKWLTFSRNSTIQLEFADIQTFTKLRLVSANDDARRDPKTITVIDGNNGNSFVLDIPVFTARKQEQIINLPVTLQTDIIRLNIVSVSVDLTQIAELEFLP